jgi:hypothetical protein
MDPNRYKIDHRDTENPETFKTFPEVSLRGLCVSVVNLLIIRVIRGCFYLRKSAFICG